jgi:hypothetical protein
MSLKAFVNNKAEWESFCEELDVWIEEQRKRLEQTDNSIEMYRAQGAVQSLRRLKFLRDKVNGHTG